MMYEINTTQIPLLKIIYYFSRKIDFYLLIIEFIVPQKNKLALMLYILQN